LACGKLKKTSPSFFALNNLNIEGIVDKDSELRNVVRGDEMGYTLE
jgi:hypothetical protein